MRKLINNLRRRYSRLEMRMNKIPRNYHLATPESLTNKTLKYIGKYFLPVFLGSFLFAGALAKYNNETTLNKFILESGYRPMKEEFMKCKNLHNEYFLKIYELSGYYANSKILLPMVEQSLKRGLNINKTVYLKSMIETKKEVENRIESLKKEVNGCYEKLYITYDDLGILLSVDKISIEIIDERIKELNLTYKEEKELGSNLLTYYNIFSTVLQQFLDDRIEELMEKDKKSIELILDNLSKYYLEQAKIEERRFNIELKTQEKLRTLYFKAIKSKFNKGIIEHLKDFVF